MNGISNITPNFMQVNGISFEKMSNDDAVRTLREIVQQPGYVQSGFVHVF